MDFFELSTPEQLLAEIQSAYEDYRKSPRDRELIFLIFALNHLVERVSDGKMYRDVKKISRKKRSDGQRFMMELAKSDDFKVLKSLCNRGKNFLKNSSKNETTKVHRPLAGLMKAGDSLGHHNDLVDGKHIREIIAPVIKQYSDWLSSTGNKNKQAGA